MKGFYSIVISVSCLIILLFYNNCGATIAVDEACLVIKETSFKDDGFHNFLKINCAECHGTKGTVQGKFADINSDVAFLVFNSFDWPRLRENSVDENHADGKNGVHNKPETDALSVKWEGVVSKYNECVESGGLVAESAFDLLTDELDIDVSDEWSTMTWSLEENHFPSNMNHSLTMEFKIDIQNYYGEGELSETPIGFLFKNPRINFLGKESKVYIESISFLTNWIDLKNFVSLHDLQVLIEKNTEQELEDLDSLIIADEQRKFVFIDDNIEELKTLSIRFTKIVDNTDGANFEHIPDAPNPVIVRPIKPEITEDVTYADLTSDGEFGVMKKNCFQCHDSAIAAGGLTLDKYSVAVEKRYRINYRINNFARPMPRGGLMTPKEIAIIERWIELGTPLD